ncbi:MAG: hypothetical protein ACAI35_11935 [Candidatus Methylacidiphilales bacterium]
MDNLYFFLALGFIYLGIHLYFCSRLNKYTLAFLVEREIIKNQPDAALATLADIKGKLSQDGTYESLLGKILSIQLKHEEAIHQFSLALERMHPDPKGTIERMQKGTTFTMRAQAREKTDDLEGARADYKASIKILPESPWARCHLASLLERMGKNTEASGEYSNLVRELVAINSKTTRPKSIFFPSLHKGIVNFNTVSTVFTRENALKAVFNKITAQHHSDHNSWSAETYIAEIKDVANSLANEGWSELSELDFQQLTSELKAALSALDRESNTDPDARALAVDTILRQATGAEARS